MATLEEVVGLLVAGKAIPAGLSKELSPGEYLVDGGEIIISIGKGRVRKGEDTFSEPTCRLLSKEFLAVLFDKLNVFAAPGIEDKIVLAYSEFLASGEKTGDVMAKLTENFASAEAKINKILASFPKERRTGPTTVKAETDVEVNIRLAPVP